MSLPSMNPLVRRIYDEERQEWYFAILDVIEYLEATQKQEPRKYWYDLKKSLEKQGAELSEIVRQFPMKHRQNNRTYQTDCANVQGVLRIIQSIPTPKAEPFKQWLAQVGKERLEDAQARALDEFREKYRAKGYSEKWIEARIKNITTRNELTDEWAERNVEAGRDMAILTSIIHRGAFAVSIQEHKKIKGLKKENLRDNMTRLELALSTLAEEATIEIAKNTGAQGFQQNKEAATKGGDIAGNARRQIEKETGKPVVSPKNFLSEKKKGRLPGKE